MKPFDPIGWIAAAIAAGMNPLVVVHPDGRRGLYCNQLDVNPAGRQEAPREGADAAAVCALLEAMGRAVDCRTTKMPGGLPCAGG